MNENLGFIHRFEPGKSEKPVVLALHGTGGTQSDLVALSQSLFPGAAILAPRGKVLENGMPRFFRRLAEGVFDLHDLLFRTQELADFVVVAAQKYAFEAANVWALGYSNGANIAASLLLARPEILSGAVLLRAMTPFEPQNQVDLTKKPIFLAAGRFDPIVAVENVENLARLLQQRGADVVLEFAESGHNLSGEEISAAQNWLEKQKP